MQSFCIITFTEFTISHKSRSHCYNINLHKNFCGKTLVNAVFVATDRGPPDVEFVGLVDSFDWSPTESIEQAEERKEKSKLEKEHRKKFERVYPNWINLECMKSSEKINKLLKTVMQ